MTTQTPTSNWLEGMATAFFQALPGTADPAPIQSQASAPGPIPALTLGQPAPTLQPADGTIAPVQVPHTGRAEGVPEAYAAALPVGAAPVVTSSAAFYFLDSTPVQAGADPLDALAEEGVKGDHVTAQPFVLPGQSDLLGAARTPSVPGNIGASETPYSAEPHFAFLDEAGLARQPRPSQLPYPGAQTNPLDVYSIRKDFPILAERVNGKPLVWFDNAATTQKPQAVIDRLADFYSHENSNIHRAAHELAARATDAYEDARQKVADFLGAASPSEIIFVRGATEGINLIANTFGEKEIGEGDEIVVSNLEHHANIVPWQQLAERKGAKLRVIPVDDNGQIRMEALSQLLGPKTKLVAITQVSNALGTVTPVPEIIAAAHGVGAKVLVDGAQSVSHMRTNVQAIDADFFVFSGHKIYGPTGIGAVYGKKALLDQLPPWQGGGNMIADVTFERTLFNPAPFKFEAGTGNIADAAGLGAALDYVQKIGIERIAQYEHFLLEYATQRLQVIPGVRIVGTATEKASVLSFILKGYKTEEVGDALNKEGIAVRSGHHCAQPILRRMGLEATVRPSFAFYNTCDEVDLFIQVIRQLAGRK